LELMEEVSTLKSNHIKSNMHMGETIRELEQRAETAEKELAALREQKPRGWLTWHAIPPTMQDPLPCGEYLEFHDDKQERTNDDGSEAWPVFDAAMPALVAVPGKKERLENLVCTAEIYLQGKVDGFNEAVDEVLRLNSGSKSE
ncbi:hypothetical protein BTJ39_22485, partial [Izhakiella australiensis]